MDSRTVEQRMHALAAQLFRKEPAPAVDYKEVNIEAGPTVRIVSAEGGGLVTGPDGMLWPSGVYRLTDGRKMIVGESGWLIRFLQPGQSDPPLMKVVREQEQKNARMERASNIYNNIQKIKNERS